MSSEQRAPSQTPINRLYVNIADIRGAVTDANLSTVSWASASVGSTNVPGLLSTPGSAILRDMGKTVYLPAGSTASNTSTMLRKVQLLVPGVANGVAGPDGTTNGASDYLTGYIQIGGMTYGGSSGAPNHARVARLN